MSDKAANEVIDADAPYSMAEVMSLLDCSDDALLERVRRGDIPAVRLGRRYLFPRSALIEGLAALGREQMRERAERVARAEAARTEHHARRRATLLQRQPPWADLRAIRQVYREARQITKATGVQYHVDHKIPLQGELVSGLHVHNNLQILTGAENIKKRNRFTPE